MDLFQLQIWERAPGREFQPPPRSHTFGATQSSPVEENWDNRDAASGARTLRVLGCGSLNVGIGDQHWLQLPLRGTKSLPFAQEKPPKCLDPAILPPLPPPASILTQIPSFYIPGLFIAQPLEFKVAVSFLHRLCRFVYLRIKLDELPVL